MQSVASCRSTPFQGVTVHGAQLSSFRGSQLAKVSSGPARVTMRKEGLHPQFFEESKVFCNGEEVLVTSGTKAEYVVDVWSGNHPFYLGTGTTVITDEGQVSRFKKRFGGLESVAALTGSGGSSLVAEFKKQQKMKQAGKGKKGGKR